MVLPEIFNRLMWSFDFDRLDLERDREQIILQAINYGTLEHWRWVVAHYGLATVKTTLQQAPATALRERVRRLVSLILGIQQFDYAPRGAH